MDQYGRLEPHQCWGDAKVMLDPLQGQRDILPLSRGPRKSRGFRRAQYRLRPTLEHQLKRPFRIGSEPEPEPESGPSLSPSPSPSPSTNHIVYRAHVCAYSIRRPFAQQAPSVTPWHLWGPLAKGNTLSAIMNGGESEGSLLRSDHSIIIEHYHRMYNPTLAV
jgi:hypothetical protein